MMSITEANTTERPKDKRVQGWRPNNGCKSRMWKRKERKKEVLWKQEKDKTNRVMEPMLVTEAITTESLKGKEAQ